MKEIILLNHIPHPFKATGIFHLSPCEPGLECPSKLTFLVLQSVSWTPGASFESKSSFSFAAPTATHHEFEVFKDATHIFVIEPVVSMFGMSKVSFGGWIFVLLVGW